MKSKLLILLLLIISLMTSFSFASEDGNGEDDVDDGLPKISKILNTSDELLVNKSSRYSLDGEEPFMSINFSKMIGNFLFGFHKGLVKVEIILVTWSYKLELYKFISGQLDQLMAPITVVIFQRWRNVALLILLLFGLVQSMNSRNTVILSKIFVGIVVVFVSLVFLSNPSAVLDQGEEVISAINTDIVNSSMVKGKGTDDYLIGLSNQIWITQVEKPWELLNFRNEENAKVWKDKFLALEYGSEERDKLTEELRKTVPEQPVGWIVTSFFIIIFSLPKIVITIVLASLNMATDVVIVLFIVIAGLIFLLSLIFGIWVLLKWMEKLIAAFSISIVVTIALTLLNSLSAVIYGMSSSWGAVGVLLVEFIIIISLYVFRNFIFGWVKSIKFGERGVNAALNNAPNTRETYFTAKEAPRDVKESLVKFKDEAKSPFVAVRNVAGGIGRSIGDGASWVGEKRNSMHNWINDNLADGEEPEDNTASSSSGSDQYKKYSKPRSRKKPEDTIKYSDYSETENIRKNYSFQAVTEDMEKEEQLRTFMSNQYKRNKMDAEIKAAGKIGPNGEVEPKYDKTVKTIMEREAKGEPLFTPDEVKKAEVYVDKMSSTNNMSTTEYINIAETVKLNNVLKDEKKYSAKDANTGKDASKKGDREEKSKEEFKHTADEEPSKGTTFAEDAPEDKVNEHQDINPENIEDLKENIAEAVQEAVNEAIGSGPETGRARTTIEDIIKNDIEEKEAVDNINKKLEKIEKKVEHLHEAEKSKNREITIEERVEKRSAKFDDYSKGPKSTKLGDHYDDK